MMGSRIGFVFFQLSFSDGPLKIMQEIGLPLYEHADFWKKAYSWFRGMVIGPFSSLSCSTLHWQQLQLDMNNLCIASILLFVQCTDCCSLVSNSILPKLLVRTNICKQILPGLKFNFFLYLLHYLRIFIDYQLKLHTYLIFVGFLPTPHDNETTFSGGRPSLAVISSLGH